MSDLAVQLDAAESDRMRTASEEPAHVADNSAAPQTGRHSRSVRLIIICGILLIGAVIAVTASLVLNLRDQQLAESERGLKRLAFVLAEQIDRSYQSIELIQTAVINRMKSLGIASAEDYERQMSGYDTYQRLKDQVSALPHIDAIVVTDTQGKLINFSRSWPIPSVKIPDADPSEVFKSDPHLTSFVDKPMRSPATGNWVVAIARKLTGPNGEFLGVVQGVMALQYFEQLFEAIVPTQNSSIGLFRRDGTLLVRYPRDETAIGQSFSHSGLFAHVLSQTDFGAVRQAGAIDGKERLISARMLSHYPIVVVATTTVADALANWERGAATMIGAALMIGLMIGGVVVFSVWRVGSRFHEQNVRLDTALNNMSQGLIMFDSTGRQVVCNDRYREMCKLPPDLARPGCTFLDILKCRVANGTFTGNPEEYVGDLMAEIAKGKSESREFKTGDGRFIFVMNQPMVGGGWVATHKDITERKQAEALIEESRKNLERAETMARLGHYKFENESNKLTWSEGIYRILGQSSASFTPTVSSILGLAHPDDRPALEQYRRDVLAGHKLPRLTLRLVKDDGQIVHVENWARPLRASDGSVTGMFGTIQDVTERKHIDEALALTNQELIEKQYAIDQAVIVGITDMTGRITYVNDKFCQISGYAREELLGENNRILNSGSHSKAFFCDMYRLIANGQVWRGALCNKAKGGSLYWVDTTIVPQLGPDGKPVGYMAIRIDITDRKRAEDELRRTKKFIDTVIEHVPVPIIVKDVAGLETDARGSRFTLFNRAYEELTGESRIQLIGKAAHQLFSKERADLIVRSDNETLRSEQVVVTSEHPIVTSHNGTRLVIAKKTVIRDENNQPQYLLTTVEDVTERRLSDSRILYMAHYDTLTDLPNRATFNDTMDAALDRAATRGEQFAVLSLDLDRFKEANDTYGHIVGDALLREVARRLRAAAGEAFLARIGGDEFALIVKDGPQPATASALADRLLAVVAGDFEIEGLQLRMGLSIGGAVYPTDGADERSLMGSADAALYRAKAEKRGTALFFEPEMSARLRERRALQEDLRSAINRGELLLHYQPQLRMAGETIGFEALVRWQCPKRGMVSPGAFIPIAEESSLIIPIGEWVLREACREAASWPQPLTIAVNISPIQFRQGDLPRLVHLILLETGLSPGRLELEITEGVMINDFSRAVSILNRLKSLGVKIAMDDFGTGFSSLSYLQSFRFDKIKIDRIFICDLEHNHHSRAIVHAVIGLGQSLNLPILAEGVETAAQHAFLVQEGCDEMQGYLTGRPLPIADYARLVGRQSIAPKKLRDRRLSRDPGSLGIGVRTQSQNTHRVRNR
jgi:PAS domain S-box/PAS domain S-box/PAS domain S-box/diguanylate cyclase (GGDEF) domain